MTTSDVKFTGFGGLAPAGHRDSADGAGRNIAASALADPMQARLMLDAMFATAGNAEQRQQLARGLAQGLSLPMMSQLAEHSDGRALLERAFSELQGGAGEPDNALAADPLGSALKAADLTGSDSFKRLDATSRQRIRDGLNWPVALSGAVDNLIGLARSPGFQAALPDTRQALLSALAQHAGDSVFNGGLQRLADDAAFKQLDPIQQTSAIVSFKQVADAPAYQGRGGSAFSGDAMPADAQRRTVLDHAHRAITAAGFQDTGPASKHGVIGAKAEPPPGDKLTARLQRLLQEPGVQALRNAALEDRLLAICSSDRDFAKGLSSLLASARYTALSPDDRAKVLKDVIKLHGTQSYKEAIGGNRAQAMVEIIGDISAQSAAHPNNKTLRNTLDHVVDGRIKVGLYYADIGPGGLKDFGNADAKGIYMNIEPRTRRVAHAENEYVDTLVHEANHKLNGKSQSGTAERFLDEYRAAVVALEATINRPLSPTEQKRIIDNLVDGTNPGYARLAELYNDDEEFKAVVDGMYATLKGGVDANGRNLPGMRVSPEDARLRLLTIDSDNEYLKKPGNLDNH
ncbi:MAG TPA: hypothetical protein VLJ62_33530 [Burkholderiaceae bacterium]|nr:hypothetical protein [Burkholderiaceae bacterium]